MPVERGEKSIDICKKKSLHLKFLPCRPRETVAIKERSGPLLSLEMLVGLGGCVVLQTRPSFLICSGMSRQAPPQGATVTGLWMRNEPIHSDSQPREGSELFLILLEFTYIQLPSTQGITEFQKSVAS